jgi:ssDNA-binding Zn-finger/Zn-ribbon topoisomerase 1
MTRCPICGKDLLKRFVDHMCKIHGYTWPDADRLYGYCITVEHRWNRREDPEVIDAQKKIDEMLHGKQSTLDKYTM